MAVTLKRLVTAMFTTSPAVMFPADLPTQIDAMTLVNNSGADVTVDVWLTTGGGATDASRVLRQHSIGPFGSYKVSGALGQVLEDGATIIAAASVDNVVNMVASGRQWA
jgi:hypothetical protein